MRGRELGQLLAQRAQAPCRRAGVAEAYKVWEVGQEADTEKKDLLARAVGPIQGPLHWPVCHDHLIVSQMGTQVSTARPTAF